MLLQFNQPRPIFSPLPALNFGATLIRRLRAGNPDRGENLQCICGTCHGYNLQADHKLCMGSSLGYLQILRIQNFDVARVEQALALFGL